MQGAAAEGPVTKTNAGRLTNAIFAFTFLLLFKNIRTPSFEGYASNTTIHQFGLMQLPDVLNFLNVFLILAMIWFVTFHVFHQTGMIDRTFLYLHFVLLMFVIFIPITSNLATVFPGNAAISVLFHINMLAIGLMLAFEWRHCQRNPGLLKPGVHKAGPPCIRTGILYIPLTAIAGIVLANFDLPYTQYIYFLAMLAFAITGAGMLDSGIQRPAVKP